MEIKSQTTKITICIIINIILFIFLYSIPIKNNTILENLCIYKLVTKKECYNCGMTRAFLSILHGNFNQAFHYNINSFIVFPFALFIYLYSWYKFLYKKI